MENLRVCVRALLFAGIAGLAITSTSSATILLNDQFVDGGRTNGADTLDTAWWLNNTAPTMTIVSDSITGVNEGSPDNALEYASTSGSTFRGFLGTFAPNATPIVLAPGDGIRLSLDYRYTADPSAAYTAAATKEGFKIGLYNNKNTANGSDSSSVDNDDEGYLTFLTNNGTVGSTMRKEDGGGSGEVGSGATDIVQLGAASTVAMPSQGTTSHTAVLEVLYVSLNNMTVRALIDGTEILNVTDATPWTSFNEVFIGQGGHFGTFRVDNIMVETIPVPEPTSLGLVGLGAMALLRRRRRA